MHLEQPQHVAGVAFAELGERRGLADPSQARVVDEFDDDAGAVRDRGARGLHRRAHRETERAVADADEGHRDRPA